jgi:Flp pilus assembly protein TadG
MVGPYTRAWARPSAHRAALDHDRQAGVTVLFAAAAIPMLAVVGLAIDYGIWNQVDQTLALAADSAALNAVKVASTGEVNGDPNYIAEGVLAGQTWFTAAASTYRATLGSQSPTVNVALLNGVNLTATVTYNGTVPSIFGGYLYKIATYPVYGVAAATVTTAPYLNVEIMLDNSSSMEIGATYKDIATLQELTPCAPASATLPSPGAYYPVPGVPNVTYVTNSGQNYGAYQDVYGGTYSGSLPQPFTTANSLTTAGSKYTFPTFVINTNNTGAGPYTNQSCKGYLPASTTLGTIGLYPLAGTPCAFACHSDIVNTAGSGNDFYAVARSTIGTANPVTLRFDVVKSATNQVISTMQGDNLPINNLAVGIFTFANTLTQVYPTAGTGTAGYNWSAAIAAVGGPPKVANGPDTGIQPDASSDQANTDFPDTMTQLSTLLTASGDGSTPATPRKVLFIVTDGLQDYNAVTGRVMSQVNPAYCQNFKNMGYTVYVVYTPYYPLQNYFYLQSLTPIAEPTATSLLATSLQACASTPSDYIAASDANSLTTALEGFLKAALSSPARFSS